ALEVVDLAALAQLVRALADRWPFLSFRLAAEPPRCRLDVEGIDDAADVGRAVFRELASDSPPRNATRLSEDVPAGTCGPPARPRSPRLSSPARGPASWRPAPAPPRLPPAP